MDGVIFVGKTYPVPMHRNIVRQAATASSGKTTASSGRTTAVVEQQQVGKR